MKTKTSGTILLVEDDPNDVFLLERAFRSAAIENTLRIAEDGQKAIDYLAGVEPFANRAEFPIPNLVLLDLKLPYKSGFEVLEWIRTQPAIAATPVVVLSSSSEEKDIQKSLRLGARSFLSSRPPARCSQI